MGSLNRRQAQSSIEQLGLFIDLGLVKVRPPTRDLIKGITGSGSKGGALVSYNKEVEISFGDVQSKGSKPVNGKEVQLGLEEEDLFYSIDSAGTKDQMVNAFIAVKKAHVEKNVDVERAKMDDWVPTTIEVEKEVAATRLSKKKAVDNVEEDASTLITQVQVVLGVEELSTETICHEQVSSKRGRSNSTTFSKHRMKTRSSKLQCSVSNQTMKPRQRTGELGEVEDGVTKTLEIGTALGFNFIGVEEEVMEAIARREEEDVANFEALNGH